MTPNDWSILARYGVTPENLHVPGSLDLRCTGVTSLPDRLSVGGSLCLNGTGITSLPDGLSVGGEMYLRGTGITSLPDGLHVGGSLDLRGTGVTSLPDRLSVGGALCLNGTGIPVIFTDARGYEFRISNGHIVAGCRHFTSVDDALNHWGADDYPNKARGQAFCNAIKEYYS